MVTHYLVLRDCVAGLALAYQAQGRSEQANEVAAKHIEFLQRKRRFAELTHAYALQALLNLRQGNLSAAQRVLEFAALGPDPDVMEWPVVPRLVQARVLLAQGDQGARRQALEILDDVAAVKGQTFEVISTNLPKDKEDELRAACGEEKLANPGFSESI
jgi:hypothetical protein